MIISNADKQEKWLDIRDEKKKSSFRKRKSQRKLNDLILSYVCTFFFFAAHYEKNLHIQSAREHSKTGYLFICTARRKSNWVMCGTSRHEWFLDSLECEVKNACYLLLQKWCSNSVIQTIHFIIQWRFIALVPFGACTFSFFMMLIF